MGAEKSTDFHYELLTEPQGGVSTSHLSSERKFEVLKSAPELEVAHYKPGECILPAGVAPLSAVLITHGYAVWDVPGCPHRLGPGAVMGMAEGLSHLPLRYELRSEGDVEARLLSILDIEMAMEKSPPKLRGIFRLSLERILGDRFFQSRRETMFLDEKAR